MFKTYTVAEIHESIDTAQERLLNEAKAIIAQPIDSKIDLLEKFGFTGTEEYKRSKSTIEKQKQARDVSEKLLYYSQKYPFQKFLTVEEFDRICAKYKLIYAPVSKYKKEVPLKNLKEMEVAKKIDIDDAPYLEYWSEFIYHSPIGIGVTEYTAKTKGYPFKVNRHFNGWIDADRYIKEEYNANEAYIVQSVRNFTVDKRGYFIAAPKSHFNLDGLKNKGLGFFNFTVTEVKDPIVFEYCKGDIIRVDTKWGDEANDIDLQVPALN